MSFRDNLLHLRAANNMTQEQLAMLLGVSRQSVTKWESEKSYPEMDKLLKMCQIFDCTLDELVQGDLTGRSGNIPGATPANSGTPTDLFNYDEHTRRFANRISNGAMAIILGVALSLIFFGAGDPSVNSGFIAMPENVAAALGLLCIFAGTATLLALIIPAALDHAHFVRQHPYIEDFYTADQKAKARTAFSAELIGGITCICIGICMVLLFAEGNEEMVGVVIMLMLIAIGVRFIIHGSMIYARVNIAQYNLSAGEILEAHEIANANIPTDQKRELYQAHKQDKRIGAVCGTIMIIATIIALLLLFIPTASGSEEYWHGTIAFFWLPWPIGGLLCGIASLLIKGFSKEP